MSDNSIGTPSVVGRTAVLGRSLARVGRLSPSLIDHLFVSLFYHNYNNNLLTLCS
nr:MAG TPA: hypothetical protein [Caudoviricetes sp.]